MAWSVVRPACSTTQKRAGDIDANGTINGLDIDLVAAAIRRGDMDIRFDVNSDEIVDHHDRAFLIRDILHTQEGDANLDGKIDFNDFQTLSSNFGAVDVAYAEGDFDGDGIVGFSDFVILSNNFWAS